MTTNEHRCKICGEPMPDGEQMFHYHGYSGPCPMPPIRKINLDPAGNPKPEATILERHAVGILNSIAALPDDVLVQIPASIRMNIDAVLAMASARRAGVQ